MAPGLMSFLRGMLGGGERAPETAAAEATEYKGFSILRRPAARARAG